MTGAVLATANLTRSTSPAWVVLTAEIMAGAVTYVLCLATLHRDRVLTLRRAWHAVRA